jgi:hypothetical protein
LFLKNFRLLNNNLFDSFLVASLYANFEVIAEPIAAPNAVVELPIAAVPLAIAPPAPVAPAAATAPPTADPADVITLPTKPAAGGKIIATAAPAAIPPSAFQKPFEKLLTVNSSFLQ